MDLRNSTTGRTWGMWFTLVALVAGVWMLATPLASGPDEPNHLTEGAAVVRGELAPPLVTTARGVQQRVQVPAWMADPPGRAPCFAFQPDVTAACEPAFGHEQKRIDVIEQFGEYPPVYYALIGWPTLLVSGDAAFWAARVLSTLICVALLTTGLTALRDRVRIT